MSYDELVELSIFDIYKIGILRTVVALINKIRFYMPELVLRDQSFACVYHAQ